MFNTKEDNFLPKPRASTQAKSQYSVTDVTRELMYAAFAWGIIPCARGIIRDAIDA